jgi:hypothetical protein
MIKQVLLLAVMEGYGVVQDLDERAAFPPEGDSPLAFLEGYGVLLLLAVVGGGLAVFTALRLVRHRRRRRKTVRGEPRCALQLGRRRPKRGRQ